MSVCRDPGDSRYRNTICFDCRRIPTSFGLVSALMILERSEDIRGVHVENLSSYVTCSKNDSVFVNNVSQGDQTRGYTRVCKDQLWSDNWKYKKSD